MTCAWTDTSSAEMGSSHTMSSGSTASARAMPIALPLAAAELVGVAVRERRVEVHQLQQLADPASPVPVARQAMDAQRLADDLAHGLAWVQARVGVLEHHLEAPSASPQLAAFQQQQVLAVEPDAPRLRPVHAHDGAAGRGLAGAGFADQPERLAGRAIENDTSSTA